MFDTGRDLYVFPVLFVIVVVGLLLEPRGTGSRVDDQAVSSWQAAREVRPIPTELRSIPAVRWAAALPLALVLLFVLTLPLWLSDSKLLIATVTGIISIVAVSLVLLTGWAGHVSLGQMAFAAVGGALGAWVTQSAGWDLGFAMLAAGLAGGVLAAVVGIPAARAGGLTLAVTTLALAPAVLFWLLNPEFFDWVPRGRFDSDPTLFGTIEIKSQMSFYFLTLGVLAWRDRSRLRDPTEPNGPRAHRPAREPSRRRGVRHQLDADDARRVRVLRVPRRGRGRAPRPPPAHGEPGRHQQPVLGRGEPPGVRHRGDRGDGVRAGRDPGRRLRVRHAVLHAAGVAVPRHRRRPAGHPADPAGRARGRPGRGPRRPRSASTPAVTTSSCRAWWPTVETTRSRRPRRWPRPSPRPSSGPRSKKSRSSSRSP